jgi:hypothetical protein
MCNLSTQTTTQLIMAVKFIPETHTYLSTNENENIQWTSVTSVVSKFKEPFDAVSQAKKSSQNKRSKWYGMAPAEIQNIWKSESERAMSLGTFYHQQRETDLYSCDTITIEGRALQIVKPIEFDGVKHAPEQNLVEGIYPEHFVYLKSTRICGQADRIEIINGKINIIDYKTNKEIKREGFKTWDGVSKKMQKPLGHLDDCNFNHYALQLSLYMYIINKHNPRYKPGKMEIHHIEFESSGMDKHDYPIYLKDERGEFIVKRVNVINVPYLKREVVDIIKYRS